MAEDQEKQEEEKFEFTAEGEALGYISLDQARVLAIQHARDNTDFYGPSYSQVGLVWEVISQEDSEDYYDIQLSFRPSKGFRGHPGLEQITIEKSGTIELRQILRQPKRGSLLRSLSVVGLVVMAVGAIGTVVLTGVGGTVDIFGSSKAAARVPTETVLPTPTVTPEVIREETPQLTAADIQAIISKALADSSEGGPGRSGQDNTQDIVASVLQQIQAADGPALTTADVEQLVVQAAKEEPTPPAAVLVSTPTATPIPAPSPTPTPTPTALPTVTPVVIIVTATPEPTITPSPAPTSTPRPPPTSTPVPPPSGLIGWWPGDGNALDVVGNNHGTLEGDTTFEPGVIGLAFSFDGVFDSVEIPISLDPLGPYRQRTIDLWFQSTGDVASTEPLVVSSSKPGQQWGIRGLSIYIEGPFAYVAGWNGRNDDSGSTTPWGPVSARSAIEPNLLYHVALVFDQTSGTITGYLNGTAFGEAHGVGILFVGRNRLELGGTFSGAFKGYFKGLIDEVRLFDRALSAAEIKAIYETGMSRSLTMSSTPSSSMIVP